jgi:hypothetical protein
MYQKEGPHLPHYTLSIFLFAHVFTWNCIYAKAHHRVCYFLRHTLDFNLTKEVVTVLQVQANHQKNLRAKSTLNPKKALSKNRSLRDRVWWYTRWNGGLMWCDVTKIWDGRGGERWKKRKRGEQRKWNFQKFANAQLSPVVVRTQVMEVHLMESFHNDLREFVRFRTTLSVHHA